jgi:Tfp pilus assembly protein PilO
MATRTVQSQIAWCARAQWTMTMIMVTMIGLFLVFGYRPTTQRLSFLKNEIANRSQLLDQNQSKAQNLPILAMEVDRLRLKLEKFNKQLPKTAELGEFIRDLTQYSQGNTIRKLIHQPGTVRRLDLYGEVPITMSFESDFQNVFNFLRELEGMNRLTRVRKLTIKTKDPKLGTVDVNMAMNIYFSEL